MIYAHTDCTEDPIMRRVPDMNKEPSQAVCPFDSSQDSSLTANSQSQTHDQLTKPYRECLSQCETSKQTTSPSYSALDQTIIIVKEKPDDIIEVHTEDIEETPSPFDLSSQKSSYQRTENKCVIQLPTSTSSASCFITSYTQTNFTSPSLKDQEVQTSPIVLPSSSLSLNTAIALNAPPDKCSPAQKFVLTQNGSPAPSGPSMNRKKSLQDKAIQGRESTMKEVEALKMEVEKLKEEIRVAESTIIWQGLMLRIQNM